MCFWTCIERRPRFPRQHFVPPRTYKTVPLVARTKERGSGWERKLTATTAQNVRLVVTLTEAGRSLRYIHALTKHILKISVSNDSPALREKVEDSQNR